MFDGYRMFTKYNHATATKVANSQKSKDESIQTMSTTKNVEELQNEFVTDFLYTISCELFNNLGKEGKKFSEFLSKNKNKLKTYNTNNRELAKDFLSTMQDIVKLLSIEHAKNKVQFNFCCYCFMEDSRSISDGNFRVLCGIYDLGNLKIKDYRSLENIVRNIGSIGFGYTFFADNVSIGPSELTDEINCVQSSSDDRFLFASIPFIENSIITYHTFAVFSFKYSFKEVESPNNVLGGVFSDGFESQILCERFCSSKISQETDESLVKVPLNRKIIVKKDATLDDYLMSPMPIQKDLPQPSTSICFAVAKRILDISENTSLVEIMDQELRNVVFQK